MAGTNLGSAEFFLRADAADLIRAMDESEKKVKASTTKIAQDLGVSERAVTQAAKKIAAAQDEVTKSNAASAGSLGSLTKSAIGFGAAAAGVGTAAAVVSAGMAKVTEETQKAAQAQFALAGVFKTTSTAYTEAIQAQAAASQKTTTEIKETVTAFGSLGARYGITTDQIKELTKRSGDLAAVHGITSVEAAKRLEGALRGEAEAAEALGLTLNSDYLKKFAEMTDLQRKNWETLDPLIKAQITYREALKQTDDVRGKAIERAKSELGAADRLSTAYSNLALVVGKSLAPAQAASQTAVAGAIEGLIAHASAVERDRRALKELRDELGLAAKITQEMQDQRIVDIMQRERFAQDFQQGLKTPGGFQGPTLKEADDEKKLREGVAAQRKADHDAFMLQRKEESKFGIEAAEAVAKRERQALDDKKVLLEIERDEKLKTVEANKDAALAGIEAESRAAAAASEKAINRLRAEESEAKRASTQRHDDEVAGLEATQKAEEDAVAATIHGLEIERDAAKQASEDRRDAAIANLDAEKRARDAVRVQEDREAEDAATAAKRREDDRHEAVIRGFDAEVKASNDSKDRQLRDLDELAAKAENGHQNTLRHLEEAAEAERDHHGEKTRHLTDEGDAAEEAHTATLRRISDEEDAAKSAHDRAVRATDDEQRAAEEAHDSLIRDLEDEGDAAQRVHDDALRGLKARGEAEDELHRKNMADLDAELRRRQDGIDAQIGALDALDKADAEAAAAVRRAGAIEAAKRGVQKAESSGNLSEIEAAQRALAEAQQADVDAVAKNSRDATRDTLKTQKDALADEISARKDAENERSRLLKQQIDDEKQAADDRLRLVKDDLDARRESADDQLDLIRADLAARKLAADDALAAITARLARERTAEDDAYRAGQDRRAKAKQELDDELKRALDRIEDEKRAEDDAFEKVKDRLDRRKTAIGDANKDELDKIAARKQAENDAHDNAVVKAQDQATQEKRAVADRRTAEDLADRDKREQIRLAFENEARDRRARYDDEATGEIPALRRALTAAQNSFRDRKIAADNAYQAEQQQITDTYNHPETGLIPLAQRAAQDVATRFRDMAREVTASAASQAAAIKEQYINTRKDGLLDLLERARADTEDKLDKQKQYWQNWQEDLAGPDGQIQKVIGKFDSLINKIKEAGGTVTVDGGPTPNNQGGFGSAPYGPGDPGGNAAYAPVVKHAGPGTAWTSGGTHGGHPAVDIMAPIGEPIYAPIGGQSRAATYPLGGNTSQLDGDDGRGYYFAHGNRPFVGGRVERGQQIGEVGDTGNAKGGPPHVHFAISSRGTGLFGELNGSGDVSGDASWWTTGAPGIPGQTPRRGSSGGQTFEFELFGRKFSVMLPFGGSGGGAVSGGFREMVERVRAAVAPYGIPPEVPAAIAGNEAGYEHPSRLATEWHNWFGVKGSGDAGQTPPLWTWEDFNKNGREDPGEQIQAPFAAYSSDGAAFADWAKQFSTGRYAGAKEAYQRSGKAIDYLEGLKAAGYATDEDWVQQVRNIGGFANGGWIDRPTLLLDEQTMRPYARAGEGGKPEWVGPVHGRSDGGPIEHMPIDISLGGATLARLVLTGMQLELARSGSLPGMPR